MIAPTDAKYTIGAGFPAPREGTYKVNNGYLRKVCVIDFIIFRERVLNMKNMMKRILCFVAALSVCCAAMPTNLLLRADEPEAGPALSSQCETLIEEEGKATTFGTAGTDLRINSRIKFDDAKDLSGVDTIECSVFVENAAALKNFVSDTQKFGLYFSSNSSREIKNRSYVDISGQIRQNGWNTVRVRKSDFTSAVNWSSVYYIYLGFTEENNVTLPAALDGKQVKYKNVCDILALPAITDEAEKPEAPEYDLVILEEGIPTKTWGAKYGFTADQIYNADSFEPAVDLSGMDRIEFDIYIQDHVFFQNAVAGQALRFTVASGATRYKNRSAYDFADQITEDGWNHIVIEKSVCAVSNQEGTTDFSAIRWMGFAFWNSADKDNPIGDTAVRVVNIGATVADYNKLPEAPDYDVVISADGIGPKTWGANYGNTGDRLHNNTAFEPAVDLSGVDKFEFDLYVEDCQAFQEAVKGKALRFTLASGDTRFKGRSAFDFVSQITEDGWNHVSVQKSVCAVPNENGNTDYAAIRWIGFSFWNDHGVENPIGNTIARIVNIGATVADYNRVPETPDYELQISKEGIKAKTWGAYYNYTGDRIFTTFDPVVDLTGVDQIEFDIYIEDLAAFQSAAAGKTLRFILASGETRHIGRSAYNFVGQIEKDGWNHIVIDKGTTAVSNENGKTDYAAIRWMGVTFWDGKGIENPIGNTVVRIANIGATIADYNRIPALPENVVAQLGSPEDGTDNRGNTVGDYFHYTMDRIYRQRISPTDFSKAAVIEFDIYVSDYEKFLAAENDPTDKQESKLSFVLSATPPNLWEAYVDGNQKDTSRVYYSSEIELAPFITHSGWNHVRVGRSDFVPYHNVDEKQPMNWSGLTAYMVYYRNSSNLYKYKNENRDLYIKVANIVNTGVVANVPKDADQASQPESNAVYISSVDGMSDENGVWNASGSQINPDYKTAGTASLQKTVNYNSKPEDTYMSYIFDGAVDLSDLKTLKYDFFIDLPQFLKNPANQIEIIIGNNRFGKNDYYSWTMGLQNLKQGWNEVALSMGDAKAVGNPDLKNIKLVMFRFTQLGLSAENFEEIVYGIDNIRYISSTGNKVLRIKRSQDESVLLDMQEDDRSMETEEDLSDEWGEKTTKRTGKTRIKKTIQRMIVPDYLTVGIVLGVEAVVLAAGVVLFIVLYRRRKKTGKAGS